MMFISEKMRKEFELAARPLMKFLAANFPPRARAAVDYKSAELLENVCSFDTEDYFDD